jgi:bla regulator protein BlaR1
MRLTKRLKKYRKEIGTLPNGITLYSVYGYNCLNGIIFPAIYVDIEHLQDDKVEDNVIQHELQHYKVRDNIWQFIRVVCLVIQWYNPLVWWEARALWRNE